jgi:hypothetical protein
MRAPTAGRLTLARAVFVTVGALTAIPVARAEEKKEEEKCVVLCRPTLKLEPALTIGNLVAPRVENVATGETRTLPRERGVELILALGIPTALRHVRITLESIFPAGRTHPELEAELNLMLMTHGMTGGWLEAHFDVVDQLSPGKRPGTERSYTHKLNFELDVAFSAFNWLRDGNWLRNVELEVSLDYVATGLPRTGDVLDGQRYLENARGWSLSFLLVMPLAPLRPQ